MEREIPHFLQSFLEKIALQSLSQYNTLQSTEEGDGLIRKEIVIAKNDAGQRLDKFLTKAYPKLPQAMLYKLIRKKDIRLNGKRCESSVHLSENDVLSLYLKEEFLESGKKEYEFLKAPKKLNILYEDENLLLLDKPPGLIVHPDETYHFDSLIARVQYYLYDKRDYDPEAENSFAPALVNRIDRNTGGIVIAAKNAEALRILNRKIKNRELDKRYLCLVQGRLKEKEGLLEGFLQKNEEKNQVHIFKKETDCSKTVLTKYRVLEEKQNCSLVEVQLLTGRTHQIRAQFSHIGHPLLGDKKYGGKRSDAFPYQALYAYQLTFQFTEEDSGSLSYLDGKTVTAEHIWFLKEFEQMH